MNYSKLTDRIAGEGSAAWDLHFQAMQRKAAGEPVIVLSVGDPDFDTPSAVVDAAVQSLRAGDTHYTAILGIPRLRTAIAKKFSHRSGLAVDAKQVAVLAGGQCALFSVAQCLLNPDDEVIVIDPAYVTYEGVFGACGARMVKVPARAENRFVVQPEDIAAAITPKTRAVLINSPHNPTGAVIPRAIWLRIAELCCQHDLWLISDEVYGELIFNGEHISPATLPGMAGRTATINSLSKSHAMTGWRLGWVLGPPLLIEHLGNLGLSMLYGCPEFIQQAACVALETELPETTQMRTQYRLRSEAVCQALADAPGIAVLAPQAGMFVMMDIRQTGLSAQQFAALLMQRHAVCVLSGDAFGLQTAGYVRLGMVEPVPVLQEACLRIAALALEFMKETVND
jgi:arginine:pyruvate transaminase